ncbi:5-methylcytosine-specific restriction endonuclease system specificity protein McrC [Eubacteriaceae bacterium RF-744-FAT-4]|uniref:5-methylcytosine-specific restriction endonuclease system specificity protein McrC n=1 Tax=Pseudoramibacter porci TaxID=2606631 RepID=A0A7X2TAK9_9FIRM|nr:5-methylcytosine-specific restriction endonuclease system specificity protein McrC [Pseudoramibacter porci]
MIPIKNVYYMLAYVFQALNAQGYREVAAESFDNAAELCSAILTKGVSLQLKRGLDREYIERNGAFSAVRGKINMSESIRARSLLNKQMICTFDDFSENTEMNRIIKTTMALLLRSDLSKKRKKALKKCLVYFGNVDVLDPRRINWRLQFNRHNGTYRMLIAICHLIIEGLIQTTTSGRVKLMDFFDEKHMYHLYEKFILAYYKKAFPALHANASQIPWQLDDDENAMLPTMQSDIMLSHHGKILIIDAKYYERTTQQHFDKRTVHSQNLYQIFTYVKNKEAALTNQKHEVSGMLLYAKTDEAIQPDHIYHMSGNQISVRTLDLNQDFSMIRKQLNDIVFAHFPELAK